MEDPVLCDVQFVADSDSFCMVGVALDFPADFIKRYFIKITPESCKRAMSIDNGIIFYKRKINLIFLNFIVIVHQFQKL